MVAVSKRKILLASLIIAVVILSFAIGFLTYPEERVQPSLLPLPTLQPKLPTPTREGGELVPSPKPTPVPAPSPTPPPKQAEAPAPVPEEAPAGTMLEVVGRMIIYVAQISMEVGDVEYAANQIQSIAERAGGFVQRISITGELKKSGVITIRVPQDKFYEVIRQIERLGNVTDKQISGEDVTEQYIDLEARLRNAEKEEERLLAILEMATDVDDVLKVEKELMRVREVIESLKAQLLYLKRRVEYSTISVFLEEPARPPMILNVRVVDITSSRATIKWTTDVPSSSLVEYGETEEYGSEIYYPEPVKEHSVTIKGLKDSTTYHFRVKSTAYGETAVSEDYTFTTKAKPWIRVPEVDWGGAIERGIWGFLVLAQALITLIVFLAPLSVIFGAPAYYLYKRRKQAKEKSEEG
ncbi:MAG TPA: DUF4349 domain-containing protein [Candidatus Korarchaeota archaeon]|nr:DUF4349 domain-containing protein [Candidatus Korarchaeota archaeon]